MAVLTSRTLIIYEHTSRSHRGIRQHRIHHKKLQSIDLRHCYLYSGLMVDTELTYQTTTFDPHLGYRILPKVYHEGWTSVDDDLSYFRLLKANIGVHL
jgi:Pleckstrin homology domain